MVNLNAEQRISEAPSISGEHSVFDRSHGWTGSFNAGKLNCYFIDEMLPSDQVNLRASFFCRMTTPYYPVYGDIFIDQYFFAVPFRLVWSSWKEFNGENNTSAWCYTPAPAHVPLIDATNTSSHRSVGDLAHQMGISPRIPSGAAGIGYEYGMISSMPFRAVRLIFNDWFRNENYEAPKLINFGNGPETDFSLFELPDVTRVKDLFGTCLPDPQKNLDTVKISLSGYVPVYPINDSGYLSGFAQADPNLDYLKWAKKSDGTQIVVDSVIGTNGSGTTYNKSGLSGTNANPVIPRNLAANMNVPFQTGSTLDYGVGIDVNELRQSIAVQRVYERLALGSRYIEFCRNFFHVISPDARQQRPELLAHRRTHVRMSDVTQSSPQVVGQTMTPLGTVGAYSKTADNQLAFSASFTEHEFLIGVFCARHSRSYSQGIPALFERKTFTDFFLPPLAHLGMQPIRKYRIFAEDSGLAGNDVWGYADAWDDGYRYFESINTGMLDPAAQVDSSGDPSGLGAVWTYGDFYKTMPTLSDTWLHEGHAEILRTLSIQTEDDFIADVWFDYQHTRPLPVHSVPGLMDHF